MIRATIFLLKLILLGAAAIWAAENPGVVSVDWLGYNVQAHVGFVLVAGLLLLFAALAVHRILLWFVALPKNWKKKRQLKRMETGYHALARGLVACAIGDSREAMQLSKRVRQLIPQDRGLASLLDAQVARLQGDTDKAVFAYESMLKNKDMAFLGLRGLMVTAMENRHDDDALKYARLAHQRYPKQPWILQSLYHLELIHENWDEALALLPKLEKFASYGEARASQDRIAIYLAQAKYNDRINLPERALRQAARAHKIDASHVPAAAFLAELYIRKQEKRAATKVIEACWRKNPHPELADLWQKLSPDNTKKNPSAKLQWFEKLIVLAPEAAESQIATARAALEDRLWGDARKYLQVAEQIEPTARLYKLFAELEESQGRGQDAKKWYERAADAPAGKMWICRETGRIFDHWMVTTPGEDLFNTIVWDYPDAVRRQIRVTTRSASAPVLSGDMFLPIASPAAA
jgi:HemY protein